MTVPFGIGSDGNYFTIGDPVRHSSDDLGIALGQIPGPPGIVEKIVVDYENGEIVLATVRWPENPDKDADVWPRNPPGGGKLTDKAKFFRKVTREEEIAERFMWR